MRSTHLLLLAPLLWGVADVASGLAWDGDASQLTQTPDETKGDDEPAAKPKDEARVAFRVTGMMKTKSGAT